MAPLLILVPLIIIILMNLPLPLAARRFSFLLALILSIAQIWVSFLPIERFWNQQILSASLFPAFNLSIDSLTLVLLLSIGLVVFASLFVGWYSIADDNKRFDFVNLLLICMMGMNGIVMVRDLFSLYVFLEITAVSSFILISLHKDKEALEGAFKYLLLSAIATILMLSSIALLLMTSGSTSFTAVSEALKAGGPNYITLFAISIFVVGLFIKGGLVPFHGWLPDAYMSAPAGVSVLLAGIVTKTTGVYTLIRLVVSVFGFTPPLQNILLLVGAISILFGAFAALSQKDFKRMLAYSSISQVGYIIISLGTGTPLGIAGAVFHLFNHSVFKTQLFANSAAVEEQTGTRDMDRLGGLANNMPITGGTSIIALLSTAGIPPLSGFWSKLIIIIALWTAGYHLYATIAVVASVVTLAYFLSMQRRVFFGKITDEFKNIKEANNGMLFPAVILALISIAVGVFFPFILNTFILPITSIFG
jgi:multicomponent Na+:H+ antiporter subunit D